MSDLIILFENIPSFFYLTVALFSVSVGSFLNVVIYRLPKMMEQGWYKECREFLADELKTPKQKPEADITLSKPASTCPKCQHKIRWYENIPLFSYLVLKGKCSNCKTPISARYPLIELATMLLSLVVANHYSVSMETVWMLILTWSLIALTMIDFDHMLLPDQIVLPMLWLGLLVNAFDGFVPLEDAVIGTAAGYLSLFSVFWIFKLLTGKEGMGYGDFKLVALFGAWIGWQLLPLLILMASAVGALIGISLMLFKGLKREQAIPFGPYIAIAGWICFLWGNDIWQWYLGTIL